jgi:hypothetical protein
VKDFGFCSGPLPESNGVLPQTTVLSGSLSPP